MSRFNRPPNDSDMETAVRTLLEGIENVEMDSELRFGIQDTPKRVVKMYREMTAGYAHKDGSHLLATTFDDDVIEQYGGMIIVRDIPFWSLCEHHMCPFYGNATVGYIPNNGSGVVGLSKTARLVELYARRLQVQERLTEQITTDLENHLKPKGVMVVLEAAHTCMSMRGVRAHGASTVTSAVRGVFYHHTDPAEAANAAAARNEFLTLMRSK